MTKLEKILKYVSEHNDFYRNRIREYGINNPLDITQWPVLTRKELQENRYNMFSEGYAAKYLNQQLRWQASSGSSGIPVNVYWERKDWYASNMELWRKRLKWYGVKPSDKYVIFTLNAFGLEANDNKLFYFIIGKSILYINISLIQSETQYREMITVINKFNPTWLYIQPTILNKLVHTYQKFNIQPPTALKYVEAVGEIMAPDIHSKAMQFFKVPIAILYGSSEMNAIAYECPNHEMHVLTDNVEIEVKNCNIVTPQGVGECIITNLNNFSMPLIRYNQNDTITLTRDRQCVCGYISPIIDIISGRSYSRIVLKNGYELSALTLSEVMAEVNNILGDVISCYSFVYIKQNSTLVCNIEMLNNTYGWMEQSKELICAILKQKLLFESEIKVIINFANGSSSLFPKNNILKIEE